MWVKADVQIMCNEIVITSVATSSKTILIQICIKPRKNDWEKRLFLGHIPRAEKRIPAP